jgi:hypothetical protein
MIGTIEGNHSRRFPYPSFSVFVLTNLKEKSSLRELSQAYEATGVRLTPRGYTKAVRKLANQGKITIARYEQLYLFPYGSLTDVKGTISMNGMYKGTAPPRDKGNQTTIERAHSTHRILLSMPYQGNQPEAGATYVKPFGRYRTARQVVYRSGNITIIAYQKKLNVWVHKPPGVRTQEQLLEAKVAGYRALIAFARTHSLTLEGYLNRILFSHHVIENEELNAAIKELIQKYPQIEERIGSKVCETSHKGKVEHEGKARIDRIVRGDMVARGLEYLTLDFPNDFSKFGTEALVPLTEQIKLHLAVQRETLEAIRELKEAIRKGKVV